MAEPRTHSRSGGFSLVEMMVAMVFVLLLMAGMASVFKASLSSFVTSGEVLSSARRNQMSINLLGDDLNNACMYLTNLVNPPVTVPANPPFCVLPNMPLVGAPATPGPNDPTSADELYFYVDQALPFEGTLNTVPTSASAAQLVMQGTAPTTANSTYTIDCKNPAYAAQVLASYNQQNPPTLSFIFKDSWALGNISTTAPTIVNSSMVQIVSTATLNASITGNGSAGAPLPVAHIQNSGIVFLQPGQVVKYSVQWLQLDPQNTNGVPCLVRDQGLYTAQNANYGSPAPPGFVASQPQQIIAENVQGFKVYLSVNAGKNWAGSELPVATSGFTLGWTGGLLADLTTQLATEAPSATTPANNVNWFRSLPTLVRVDITTRTAAERTEYSANPTAATPSLAYKTLTQSLVYVPRHSGLPMD
jgi:hypothetical protein